MAKIKVLDTNITTTSIHDDDYIFLTDIAKYKNTNDVNEIIRNWLRNRNTIEFLGTWKKIYNPRFKTVKFDGFREEAGLNSFRFNRHRLDGGVFDDIVTDDMVKDMLRWLINE